MSENVSGQMDSIRFSKIPCPKHQKDVIQINLTPEYQGNRLLCVKCNFNKQTNLIYLGNVFRFLGEYDKQCKEINKEFDDGLTKLKLAKKKISDAMDVIEKQLAYQKQQVEGSRMIKNEDLIKYLSENISTEELKTLATLLSTNVDVVNANLQFKLGLISEADRKFLDNTNIQITLLENLEKNLKTTSFIYPIPKIKVPTQGYEIKYENDQSGINSLQFNRTSQYLAVGGNLKQDNCFLRLYKINEQNQLTILQNLQGHQGEVKSICFSQIDDSFLTGSVDKSVILWKQDRQSQWTQQKTLLGHQLNVSCVKFSNKENTIATCGAEIIIWQKISDDWENKLMVKSTKTVLCLSFNEDDKLLVSGGHDTITTFEYNDKWESKQQIEITQSAYLVAFFDKVNFISLFRNNSFGYYTLSEQQVYNQDICQEDQEQIQFGSFCQRKRLLTISSKNSTKIYQISNDQKKKLIQELPIQTDYTAMSNDGFMIASANKGKLGKLYIHKCDQKV